MLLILMLGMLAASLFTMVGLWREAFRVFGARAPALGLRVVRLRSRQPFRYGSFTFQVFIVVLGSGYFVLMLATGDDPGQAALPVGIGAVVLLQFLVPPAVVFLGKSTPDAKRLFAKVRWEVPGRSLSLLQSGALDVIHGPSFTRTTDSAWRSTVRELMTLVPLIVVDARVTSRAVRQEVEWIVDSALWRNVVFIIGDDGRDEVLRDLQALRPDVRIGDLTVISERHINTLPRHLNALH